MTIRIRLAAAVLAGTTALAVLPSTAEEPAKTDQPTPAEEAPICGRELMTPEELDAHREKLRSLATPEERAAYRAAHHAEMEERAKQRGRRLSPESCPRGPGMGIGPGGGPGPGPGPRQP